MLYNSVQIVRLHPILMSILLHHFKQLTECAEQVKKIESWIKEITEAVQLGERIIIFHVSQGQEHKKVELESVSVVHSSYHDEAALDLAAPAADEDYYDDDDIIL